jgi:cytochrome P450
MTASIARDGTRTLSPAGHMRRFFDSPLEMLAESPSQGDLVRWRFGPFRVFAANSPEVIHDVLVANAASYYKSSSTKAVMAPLLGNGLFVNDGDSWRTQRKLVSPAFHHKRIAAYADLMVDYAQSVGKMWQDGAEIDLEQFMTDYTIHVVSKSLFDAEVSGQETELREVIEQVLRSVDERLMTLFPTPMWVPSAKIRRYKAAIARLDELIYQIIADRRAGKTSGQNITDKGDALSMLLLSQDEQGSGMTDKQVRDEVMTLFGAGHETTSRALTWTWYLLSQNPEVEQRFHDELQAVLGGRTPTLEDLAQLTYTEQIVKESMRLYPPAWVTTRQAHQDTTLGGEPVKKNNVVIINIWGVHHNPNLYPDPWAFKPERFTPEFEKSLPKSAYLPFGNGPRVCIGNAFAMMEAKIALAVLGQRFKLSLKPGHPVEPQDMFTLRPKYGMQMHVTVRQPELA